MRAGWIAVVSLVAACGPAAPPGASADGAPDPATPDGSADAAAAADAAPAPDAAPACIEIGAAPVAIAAAAGEGEQALWLTAASASATRWAETGNEALVLEIRSAARGLIGHLVLHQGARPFEYAMSLGRLPAGDVVTAQLSGMSASAATPEACVGPVRLETIAEADAEAIAHAPIFRWPVAKRFDDLPVLLGWSQSRQEYQAVYTSENGGTVASCGGGADGMEAEIARWGRGCDIERVFGYGDSSPTWGRCTGTASYAQVTPRREGEHPIFYYGDGHNRLYESRGGYGAACGTGGPERADGDLTGWNRDNPGNAESEDGPFVVTLRPLPVELDSLGYGAYAGRREGLLDAHAPWIYRLTFAELEREGKIDGVKLLPIDRYLYVDIHAADVDGNGDRVCASGVSKGFVVRMTSTGGPILSGPQMTASYFGADDDWKRIAIPLDRLYETSEITGLVFDAYDNDGIYLLGLGAAFIVRPDGDNGATLDPFHEGELPLAAYVDDDRSGCTDDLNHDGPGGLGYPCTGSDYAFAP